MTGMVDKRTMEKYEKEAKEQGRESWYISWALDTNVEERAKVCFLINSFPFLFTPFVSFYAFSWHRFLKFSRRAKR